MEGDNKTEQTEIEQAIEPTAQEPENDYSSLFELADADVEDVTAPEQVEQPQIQQPQTQKPQVNQPQVLQPTEQALGLSLDMDDEQVNQTPEPVTTQSVEQPAQQQASPPVAPQQIDEPQMGLELSLIHI